MLLTSYTDAHQDTLLVVSGFWSRLSEYWCDDMYHAYPVNAHRS